jgi:hypothetical protein
MPLQATPINALAGASPARLGLAGLSSGVRSYDSRIENFLRYVSGALAAAQ